MARRRRLPKRDRKGVRAAARRRRLARVAGLLAGTVLAAGGGWVYATTRPPTPASAQAAVPARPVPPTPAPHPFRHAMAPPPSADVVVHGGAIQAPVVDFTEILPGCHK